MKGQRPDASFSDRDDLRINPSSAASFRELAQRRFSRRSILHGLSVMPLLGLARGAGAAAGESPEFPELGKGLDDHHRVAEGHLAEPLIGWGDPLFPDAPRFDPLNQRAAAQERQFGYDCDFTAFLPLPRGSGESGRGLLIVNHETTSARLMFAGLARANILRRITREQVEIELAAHGVSIIEIQRHADGAWTPVLEGACNRRITPRASPVALSGPAAGDARLRTSADPTGRMAIGTLGNCAGGVTPWGTVLTAEENFPDYFSGDPRRSAERVNYQRLGFAEGSDFPWWARHLPRFDLGREPNEPNRFGWVVEIDPYDPGAVPVKRTALGRFKHEGAAAILNGDGRVVVYSGDDQRFEYVYRFVSARRVDPVERRANRDLLDGGVLSVARFEDSGWLTWLPLRQGEGPLTPANGFHSQADVVIEARRAADLLGATPMDRPEDIEPNPVTGSVFAVFTGNEKRGQKQAHGANPRAGNGSGHIVEMIPPGAPGPGADHAAERFRWEMFILAGDPADPAQGASYPAEISADGWFVRPDNCAFDSRGRMWIATDGAANEAGFADGLWVCDLDGAQRGRTRHFFRAPRGAEVTGPSFTPDGRTLFVSVQHPGREGRSSFERPSTRWPDFNEDMPPRPAVVAIRRADGGPVG